MDNDQLKNEWLRVTDLYPQLGEHVNIYSHVYRGDRWYVLHDTSSGRHLRVNESARAFIVRLNGDRSVDEIWQIVDAELGEQAPSKAEIVRILAQLFAIDLLNSGLPVDVKEFFDRYRTVRNQHRRRAAMNPLAVRFPLFDPDQLLNRLMFLLRPLFSWTGLIAWLVIVGFACLLAVINLSSLQAAINPDILAPENMLLMLALYCLIKLVHEFAHGFTVKMWGGEVHEMGITLLVLMPIPYVDASSAWAFSNKHNRMLVGVAGIVIELLLAAVALFVWLTVEPGLLKDAALNVVLIGSVSTLLFNANPLLRFDGYYVLQDLLEIPNLYGRASRYYIYLIQRYLFGLDQASSPVTAKGEAAWFAFYGLAAFVYRLFIMVVIALFLIEQYFFVGVALAMWAILNQLIMPMFKGLRFLTSAPALEEQRTRAGLVTSGLVGGILLMLLFLPVSLTTQVNGVVWVSDQAQLFAETNGFVEEIMVQPGSPVAVGVPILRMRDPTLDTRIEVLEAKRRGLELRSAAERLKERVQSDITMEELAAVESELKLLKQHASALIVRAKTAGKVILPGEKSLNGLYLKRGDLVGYVASPEHLIVRAVIPQENIGLVQKEVSEVQVRFAERLGQTIDTHILRETPAANKKLPSAALGVTGGGDIVLSMGDDSGRTAAEKFFQLDMDLPAGLSLVGLGERAYVRINHGTEPLAKQWLRSIRQLFLSRLSL